MHELSGCDLLVNRAPPFEKLAINTFRPHYAVIKINIFFLKTHRRQKLTSSIPYILNILETY